MNILIIDDHQILKEGIIKRFEKILPKANCYFVDNVKSALSKIYCIKIDLILCDLEFNNDTKFDGFYFIEKILKFDPRSKVIAFTNYNSYRIMKKALNTGFLSFLDKGCTFKTFEKTIINVLQRGFYTSETMSILLKNRNQFKRTIFSNSIYGIHDLSAKELQLTILCKETTDRQKLAKLMGNTPYTIDTYFKNIVGKLNLRNRQEVSFFSIEFKDELLKKKHIVNGV